MAVGSRSNNLERGIESFKTAAEQSNPMNPKAKEKILKALRSGEYSQTRGYLKTTKAVDIDTPAGHCCLGVFTEVAMQNGLNIKTEEGTNPGVVRFISDTSYEHGYSSKSTAFLLQEVFDWLGWDYANGRIDSSLMSINDNGGSFDLIADLIEEYL